ncbi:MAG: hypothetical protein ACREIC_06920, partial [Limisphaerales bacterium]
PAIKGLGEGKLERLFYLTARTVGRTVAEKALADLRSAGLKLRAVETSARSLGAWQISRNRVGPQRFLEVRYGQCRAEANSVIAVIVSSATR